MIITLHSRRRATNPGVAIMPRPTRRNLILRAQRLRRLHAELSQAAIAAQLTPAEVNIIEHASKALYQIEFILSVSARRANPGNNKAPIPPSAAWDQQS